MAVAKKKLEEGDVEEALDEAVDSAGSARPHRPPQRNTTFAERAKAAGRNKRVSESDSK